MRDYLLDIVKNTYGLGIIDLIKVQGTDTETAIDSISADRSVIIKAKLNKPVPEFNGTFGMPNLSKLNTILNCPEYATDAKISLIYEQRNNESVATGLHFENQTGDYKNDYRFMLSEQVNDKLKTVTFKRTPSYQVEFVPSVNSIQRLKFQANANSDETTFTTQIENGNLKVFIGDHSTHAGNFIFQSDVSGLTKKMSWPTSVVISILNLPGDKVYKISDDGVTQITVNSGLATYDFILPAFSK